ncbi:MAG: alpha/beta hydrolase [Candidatus Giovannonibacteria bacterium]|nr:alpha/beta hydrolase [Candidatus Giovannonibacteria bacterium]
MEKNKKIVFIIHGWWGYQKEGWFPWLKKELEKRGFRVFVPKMPETGKPKISRWVGKLAKIVRMQYKNTYFVGHSIGAQAIMRYLEKLPKSKKIGGAVFVAGWVSLTNQTPEEKPIAKPWLRTPLNFKKIKNSGNKFVAIFSDGDPYVHFSKNSKVFRQKLGAKIIVQHKKGHFSGSDGVKKLPVVLNELLKIVKK